MMVVLLLIVVAVLLVALLSARGPLPRRRAAVRPMARDQVHEDVVYEQAVFDERPVLLEEPVAPSGSDDITQVVPLPREEVVEVHEVVRRPVTRRRRRVIQY
jgi:hypothetical protein